jgi:hypothetical protein
LFYSIEEHVSEKQGANKNNLLGRHGRNGNKKLLAKRKNSIPNMSDDELKAICMEKKIKIFGKTAVKPSILVQF